MVDEPQREEELTEEDAAILGELGGFIPPETRRRGDRGRGQGPRPPRANKRNIPGDEGRVYSTIQRISRPSMDHQTLDDHLRLMSDRQFSKNEVDAGTLRDGFRAFVPVVYVTGLAFKPVPAEPVRLPQDMLLGNEDLSKDQIETLLGSLPTEKVYQAERTIEIAAEDEEG